MNEKVDVLAVIERAAVQAYNDGYVSLPSELKAAHAAVAELIEADREFDAAFNAVRFDRTAESLDKLGTASDRRAAALANAGGAK